MSVFRQIPDFRGHTALLARDSHPPALIVDGNDLAPTQQAGFRSGLGSRQAELRRRAPLADELPYVLL